MNTIAFARAAGFALLLSPFAAGAEPENAGEAMFVHGSWVNVREGEDPQSHVAAHLVTNTQVRVTARGEKMCAIRWNPDDLGLAVKLNNLYAEGFVACSLLGTEPLALKDTQDPLRRFWISPSSEALQRAGKHFERTLLSEKQKNIEQGLSENGKECSVKYSFLELDLPHCPPRKIVRHLIPEFEAMKTTMLKGVVVGRDQDAPLVACSSQPLVDIEGLRSLGCQLSALPDLQLPKIRPSRIGPGRILIMTLQVTLSSASGTLEFTNCGSNNPYSNTLSGRTGKLLFTNGRKSMPVTIRMGFMSVVEKPRFLAVP